MNRKNSRHGGKEKRHSRSARLEMEALEPLNMLTPVFPDLFAWESGSSGYSHDYLMESDLLRFTTAQKGAGHLEVPGGQASAKRLDR